jgi:hypothetical protein
MEVHVFRDPQNREYIQLLEHWNGQDSSPNDVNGHAASG